MGSSNAETARAPTLAAFGRSPSAVDGPRERRTRSRWAARHRDAIAFRLRDEQLGDVVSAGSPDRFTARTLAALAEGAGATLPRAPGETVLVRTARYLTQDRGALVEATATIAYPELNEGGVQRDVLLFLHGTSGFTAGCGTSDDVGNRQGGAGHVDSTFWALAEILRFIDARVAGETFEAPASCDPPAASRCEGTP